MALASELMFSNTQMNEPVTPADQLFVDLIAVHNVPVILCSSKNETRCVWIVKEWNSTNYVLWFAECTVSELHEHPHPMFDISTVYMRPYECIQAVKAFIEDGTLPEIVMCAGNFKDIAGRPT